ESPSHFLTSPLTPGSPDTGNFGKAWSGADLGVELANTVIYSVAAAALSTVLGLLIAFPIARRLIRGHSALYTAMFTGLFLPLAIIPLFAEARMLGLYNNRLGYIVLHVEPGLPLAVILLVAFITAIPAELDEAAWMEGAGYLRYLLRVVVPLTRPALLIAFLYGLLGVWNDIIGPVVLLSDSSLFPVTRGIYNFFGSNESQWTLLAAAIVIASLPVVALFAASQRQLIRATVAGSVKA
ncbi:MAG: carbohydrate ABC transporter permease, partial [Streptosporangiaceae bacterium]|nr:carbohydrate ABC transporter permease [Streptosporangiaceae bacterium]